jgi:hypothetical protein
MLAHPILHGVMTAMVFSMTGNSKGDGLSSEINVAPLIDVLLVMLIIFMVIVPVMPRGLNSALPSPVTPRIAEAADHPVLVQVEQGQTAVRYVVDGVDTERDEVGRGCWSFCREDPFARCSSGETRSWTSESLPG